MPKGKTRPFTAQEELKIKNEYLSKPIKTLAAEIGVGQIKVRNFMKKHCLIIPPELAEMRRKKSYFKKGQQPWSAGKKRSEYMSQEAIEKIQKTQFKKGHLPHNTKYNGCIVERKDKSGWRYKYIRISSGKWEELHRYLWRNEHGEIPKGKIIAFKDNDPLNCTLENLEVISLEENMLRNSRHNFPREIVPTMALIAELEKSIKSKITKNGKK